MAREDREIPKATLNGVVLLEKRYRQVHPYNKEGFLILSMKGLAELDRLLAERRIGMQAVRVLIAMTRASDFENAVRAGQKDLAARLGMDQRNVSKAIRDLMDAGLVEPPEWSRGPYTISPRLLWKGSARTLKLALEQRAA